MSEYIFKPNCSHHFEMEERDKTTPVDWYGTLHGEIVRCRDCKWFKHNSFPRCDLRMQAVEVEPDGFCAWASRREGAES